MDKPRTKIALVVQSLAGGGAERSCALLSQLLHEAGFEVHIITVLDAIEYEYSGVLFNLGKFKNPQPLNRLNRLKILRDYLREHAFDWVIDSRTRSVWWSEWMITRWVYPQRKTIYMVRSYDLKKYFPLPVAIAKSIYGNAPHIVAVSDQIKQKIESEFQYRNVTRIYNPVQANGVKDAILSAGQYIIAYGRIDDQVKNYSLLIDAYSISVLPGRNISLYILGDGPDVGFLKQKAKAMGIEDQVVFQPKTSEPFPMVQSALFTALTSRYEGFPRVLIESLALGTPVISVDCHSGPSEIIQNENNGLLVANHHPKALAQAMNRLVEDTALYQKLKKNAKASIAHLSPSEIAKNWMALLQK